MNTLKILALLGMTAALAACGGGGSSSSTPVTVTPTASLSVDKTAINSGESAMLSWTSSSAQACSATDGWSGTLATSGSQSTGALTGGTTFSLTCSSGSLTSAKASVRVEIIPTVTLTATPASVASGGTAQLTWNSTDATSCTASGGWTGVQGASGSQSVGPFTGNGDYSYTLVCSGPGGDSAPATTTVTVSGGTTTAAPTATLTANPTTLTSGGASTLTWSSTNATACTAAGGWTGTKATSGTSTTAALSATTTYALACTGTGGSGNASVTVTVVTGSMSPGTVALTIGQTQAFTKTLSGSATYSVDGVSGGNASVGNVSATGVYVAGTATGAHTVLAVSTADATQTQSATAIVTDLAAVATFHNSQARDGANTQEYALNTTNVKAATFGKLASCTLDGTVVAQPLWVAGLTIGGSRHNVVFVGTHHDGLYAIDGDALSCVILWHMNLIDTAHGAGANETPVPGDKVGAGYQDIMPEVGITGTPVIDLANNILYVVTKSWVLNSTMYTRLHAIDLATGAEKAGSPIAVSGTVPGAGTYGSTVTFDTPHHLQRAGLALANGTVYVSFTAHEDAGSYFGWVFGYRYVAGAFTQTSVINVSPDYTGSGIWMAGGAPAVDSSNNLFLLTGNGQFNASPGLGSGRNYGDSLLKLTPTLAVSQYWTPADQADDQNLDNDFGAGGAAMLADLPAGSSYMHVLACGGKSGRLEILNRDTLGGYTGAMVQELNLNGPLFATAAVWNNRLYVAAGGQPLQQYNLNTSTVQFTIGSATSTYFKRFGANPIISASGTGNGVVWAMETDNYCTSQSSTTQNGVTTPHCGPVVLHAYDALNVSTELWNSSAQSGDVAGYAVKFSSPMVANGHVYVGTRGNNTGGLVTSTSQPGTLEIYGLKP